MPAADVGAFEEHAHVVVERQGQAQRLGLSAQRLGRLEREAVGERLSVQDGASITVGTASASLRSITRS